MQCLEIQNGRASLYLLLICKALLWHLFLYGLLCVSHINNYKYCPWKAIFTQQTSHTFRVRNIENILPVMIPLCDRSQQLTYRQYPLMWYSFMFSVIVSRLSDAHELHIFMIIYLQQWTLTWFLWPVLVWYALHGKCGVMLPLISHWLKGKNRHSPQKNRHSPHHIQFPCNVMVRKNV